jgi:hypothetical protein
VHDLRQILDEAISRIKDEVFSPRPRQHEEDRAAQPGAGEEGPRREPGDGTHQED